MRSAQDIKNNLTNEDIIYIMQLLGATDYKPDGQGNLIFPTLCHNFNNEGSYKLYYYTDSHMFHCYTECGDSFDIFELIQRNKKISFIESLKFIHKVFNVNDNKTFYESTQISDWELLDRYIDFIERGKNVNLSFYNENLLNVFEDKYYYGWVDEGISIDTMQRYNIKFDISRNKIIIPHYDINSNLIGIRGRALNQDEINNGKKYMPLTIENITYSHPIQFNLYGLHKTKEAIKESGRIVLFEGEKSVLKADTLYGDNNFTVAVCGNNISNYQRDLILSLGVREVFLGFDKQYYNNDDEKSVEEKHKYIKKIKRLGYKFAPYVTTWVLWDEENVLDYKESPVDKGKEALEYLMQTKQEIFCRE